MPGARLLFMPLLRRCPPTCAGAVSGWSARIVWPHCLPCRQSRDPGAVAEQDGAFWWCFSRRVRWASLQRASCAGLSASRSAPWWRTRGPGSAAKDFRNAGKEHEPGSANGRAVQTGAGRFIVPPASRSWRTAIPEAALTTCCPGLSGGQAESGPADRRTLTRHVPVPHCHHQDQGRTFLVADSGGLRQQWLPCATVWSDARSCRGA